MARLINFQKKDGSLLSVTFEMTTDKEKRIYKSFVDGEPPLKCPKCGKEVDKEHIDKYYIVVYNPLSGGGPLGFQTGTPSVWCPHCKSVVSMSMMDITPFTAIINWLAMQRQKARRKR